MRKRPSTKEENLIDRRSFIQLSALTSLAVTHSIFAALTHRITPVDQPETLDPMHPSVYPYKKSLPSPDASIDVIMKELLSPEEYIAFVTEHTTFETPSFPVEFFDTYRRSPEDFQAAGWKGCCNDYAEFACNWAYLHRYSPYIVSICPKGVIEPIKESWHQFAVIRTSEDQYVILDNTTIHYWISSIDDYIAEHHSGSTLLPLGGCVQWQKTKDNWTARMAQQGFPNEDNLEISEIPYIPTGPMPKYASIQK